MISCSADPFDVAMYPHNVLFISGIIGLVITEFYGIRWGHHVMGFNSPTENPFVHLAFEVWQRLCKTEATKKEPITSETIKSLAQNTVEKF